MNLLFRLYISQKIPAVLLGTAGIIIKSLFLLILYYNLNITI